MNDDEEQEQEEETLDEYQTRALENEIRARMAIEELTGIVRGAIGKTDIMGSDDTTNLFHGSQIITSQIIGVIEDEGSLRRSVGSVVHQLVLLVYDVVKRDEIINLYMESVMKTIFNCTWGSIELVKDGKTWSVSVYGNCPKEVKDGVAKLNRMSPKPDFATAHFFLKQVCGKTLLYVK